MMQRILIVDDEQSIVTLLKYNIEKAGFETDAAFDGEEAIQKIEQNNYDLVILDVMLPKLDGMEIIKTLRQNKNNVPVLMATALDTELDKILGLEFGADDYLTKPFSPKEVVARIKAILRRSGKTEQPSDFSEIKIGELTIFPEKYEVKLRDEALHFTRKEFELLKYLAVHKGKVLTRDQLLNEIWNYDYVGDTRIVDVHIGRIRDKIETDTKNPNYIKTIHGLGYKLEDPT
ncbi:response regulator transcription factor [Ornithinibacillus sp. 4-3]|uniref:Response regulator transcription factor n=1 Tax=Ornithinibacillus sp. 4-3 TaxID=3231488 RepID=A0AB39HRE2_9BACI